MFSLFPPLSSLQAGCQFNYSTSHRVDIIAERLSIKIDHMLLTLYDHRCTLIPGFKPSYERRFYIMAKSSTGLDENMAALLCYVLGWITGLIFFLVEKDSKFVRFHAMQSIVVFGVLTVVNIVLSVIPGIGWLLGTLLGILAFVLWIILMIKAYQGVKYRIPWAADIADKNA
jgi:uncharacterized membrane protein